LALSCTVSKILTLESNLWQLTVKIDMIPACTVLTVAECDGQTDRHRDNSQMCETSHDVAHEKSCDLKFCSLTAKISPALARPIFRSLWLALAYRSINMPLTVCKQSIRKPDITSNIHLSIYVKIYQFMKTL